MFMYRENIPMYKKCLTFFSFLLISSFPGELSDRTFAAERPVYGKDTANFWQAKRVNDWSPQELQLFLQDSPWAKTRKIEVAIENMANPAASQSAAVPGAVQMTTFSSCCRTFEVPMAGSNSETADGSRTSDSAREPNRTWTFGARFYWFSSVSIRRAILRQRQLQGIPMEQADAALAPSNDLILAISGSVLKLLEGLPLNEVKKISVLKATRGNRNQLAPAEYIPAQGDGDPMAFLIFPKTVAGKPSFSLKDEAVVFAMKGSDFSVECQFQLEPMVINGKLDW
jgi:hypothetical protein